MATMSTVNSNNNNSENMDLELEHLVDNEELEEELEENNKPKKQRKYPYLGVLLATISSFFFSICSVIVKWMVHVNPMQLAICRFIGVLLPAIPILIYKNEHPFPKGKRIMLLLRSFAGTTGLMLSFYAFRHMHLADASVIVFSVPVFVSVFAFIFLKEPCGFFNIMTIVLTLFGVVLITRPPFLFGSDISSIIHSEDDASQISSEMWGAIAALSGTIFGANAIVLIRALKGLHFSVIMSTFGGFALFQTFGFSCYYNILCWPACGLERFLVVLLALFSFAGQILLTLSLQLEEAGPVAIARSADIVFAFIWQVLFFQEVPNICSIMGALLVTSCVILTGLRKWALSLPHESSMKHWLGILAK